MVLDKKYVDQVTPEQVIKIYAKHGQAITVDQVNEIIEFMYLLAEIALDIAEEELRKEELAGSNSEG